MALSGDVQSQLLQMRRDSEERDAERRAQTQGHAYLPPKKVMVTTDALGLIPEAEARDAHCAVLVQREKKIAVAAYDALQAATKKKLEDLKAQGYAVTLYICSLSTLEYIFLSYKMVDSGRTNISGAVKISDQSLTLESLDTIQKTRDEIIKHLEGNTSDLVQLMLMGAVANRASDVHFEPEDGQVKLRYRIDGLLYDIYENFTPRAYRPILSRIKLLSGLKINVHDKAQDGRFTIDFPGRADIEIRVALAPSEYGEVIVMRLLDPNAIALELKDLGIREDDLQIISEQLDRPNGMALNTGPTGSGKTTTLYAFLKHRLNPEVKIITVEDPIEYHLKGIEQTQVNDESGYTFANGLRSLMRQDPDIILVGEIRDKETAEIAVQAALTGHLVFSTVHANEAAGGVARLLDLGVKANSLAPALNLLIAQRLLRRLCKECKKKKEVSAEEKERLTAYVQKLPDRVAKLKYISELEMYEPVGCSVCNNTGYKGRVGVYELLVVNPEIQDLISQDAGQLKILEAVKKTDFTSMQADGILKVMTGLTTLEEVEDITGKMEW